MSEKGKLKIKLSFEGSFFALFLLLVVLRHVRAVEVVDGFEVFLIDLLFDEHSSQPHNAAPQKLIIAFVEIFNESIGDVGGGIPKKLLGIVGVDLFVDHISILLDLFELVDF